MLKEKLHIERKEAVMLTVDFSGKVEEYAMAWLKLTNNAREYGNMIWKIRNSKSDLVYVICNPKHAEQIKDFCTGIYRVWDETEEKMHSIGKVTDEQKITIGVPAYEVESTYSFDDPNWEKDMDNVITEWVEVEDY